jgi:hypothetical protein
MLQRFPQHLLFALVVIGCGIDADAADPVAPGTGVTEPPVKLSRSGICHDRSSPNYRQLSTYDSFDTLAACEAAGGRRPDGARSLAYEPRPANPPWWADVDWGYWVGWIVIAALIVGPMAYAWYRRRKTRGVVRRAERKARQRWDGHRLDRPGTGRDDK